MSFTSLKDADLAGGEPEVASWKRSSSYEYLRLADLQLQPGNKEKFNGYTLQWLREPVSGMRLFCLEDGFPDVVRYKVNRVLVTRLWEAIDASFKCLGHHKEMGDSARRSRRSCSAPGF